MSKDSLVKTTLPNEDILQRLHAGNWSWDSFASLDENWKRAVLLAPEIAEKHTPYKKTFLQKISENLKNRPSSEPAVQSKVEPNAFSAYLETKETKQQVGSAKHSESDDAGETIYSAQSMQKNPYASVQSQLNARDFAIFQQAMQTANRVLGQV